MIGIGAVSATGASSFLIPANALFSALMCSGDASLVGFTGPMVIVSDDFFREESDNGAGDSFFGSGGCIGSETSCT